MKVTTRKTTTDFKKQTDVLVVGNGLDLHCGLCSGFKDFFDTQLRFRDGSLNPREIKRNIWYLIFTYAFMLNSNHGGTLVQFVGNSEPLWMDVEGCIDNVFVPRNLRGESEIYRFITNRLRGDANPEQLFDDSSFINGDDRNQRYQIGHRVSELRGFFKSPDALLMSELNVFEKAFTDYLKKEICDKAEVYKKRISDFILNKLLGGHPTTELFVLSFNYTRNFPKSIRSDQIYNIHGTLERNNIIIGIGDRKGDGPSGRDAFRKTKRRLENNLGGMQLPKSTNVRSVIFYGCSFSEQDWSYYRLLFKKYQLGSQTVLFKFLYSDFCSKKADNDKNRSGYYKRCAAVVNSYLQENGFDSNFEGLYNLGYIDFCAVD